MSKLERDLLESAERLRLGDNDESDPGEKRTESRSDSLEIGSASLTNGFYTTPTHRGTLQTGPKGVIEDYRRTKVSSTQNDASFKSVEAILAQDEEDQLLGDQEDPAVAAWRTRRLHELKSNIASSSHEPEDGHQTFGHFREIGLNSFESAVLEEDPAVKVVLHLFEPHIPACLVLNLHLSNIARDFPQTKFLRAQASEVDFMSEESFEAVLPSILVYQGGELIANLVAIHDNWSRKLDYEEASVIATLAEHGVLTINSSTRTED